MYWLFVYMIYVYIHCVCVGGDWGCTPRFREDRGWTSKPDCVWHWYSTTMCIKCWLWKCLNWFYIALKCISLSIVRYRSVSMLCWYNTKMCIVRIVWKWLMCYWYSIKMCIPHKFWKCFKDESKISLSYLARCWALFSNSKLERHGKWNVTWTSCLETEM